MGIFRLTPGGMTVVRLCPKRGFHPHEPPSDGSPDVYMNPTLKVDIIDLRRSQLHIQIYLQAYLLIHDMNMIFISAL
ncbi:Hypothetical predicted protein [Olea europaea subsp. europaea]|nr:Hypothetical predicted protein [Olea europaea subsp. europaea]